MTQKLLLTVLLLILSAHATFGCKSIERRAMSILEKGTAEQVVVFNKLKEGATLNEADVTIFHNAQEDAFQQMFGEVKEALENHPFDKYLQTGFSDACVDSTMALSDMTENNISATEALERSKSTYPYRLRSDPSTRNSFDPYITWASEDAATNSTYTYKVNGKTITDNIRLKIQEKGGLNWLRTVKSKDMLEDLEKFLTQEEVLSIDTVQESAVQPLREMQTNEEGALGYFTRIVTINTTETGTSEFVATKNAGHANFIYKMPSNKVIMIDTLYDKIITLDLRLDETAIKSKLQRTIKNFFKTEINRLIESYEKGSSAEKALLKNTLEEYLGRLPEPGERFKGITDTTWRTITRHGG